jgi:hypothetical protein
MVKAVRGALTCKRKSAKKKSMSQPVLLNRESIIEMLEIQISKFPSARQWAIANGLSEAYVSDVRSGRRQPGAKILAVLGVQRVEAYEGGHKKQ